MRQGCVLPSLRYSSSHSSDSARTRTYSTGLAHLQEQPAKVDPEKALECARRVVWGTLYPDDACIVSRSPRGFERRMAVYVEAVSAFGPTISQSKTETIRMPRAPTTKIVFTAKGQHYRQTSLLCLSGGGAPSPKPPNLSAEIGRCIRAG